MSLLLIFVTSRVNTQLFVALINRVIWRVLFLTAIKYSCSSMTECCVTGTYKHYLGSHWHVWRPLNSMSLDVTHRIPCSWSQWPAKGSCHVLNQTRVIPTTSWILRSWTLCVPYISFIRPVSLAFSTFEQKSPPPTHPQKQANKHGVDTAIIIFAQCLHHLCFILINAKLY